MSFKRKYYYEPMTELRD